MGSITGIACDLPNELWGEIFIRALPTSEKQPHIDAAPLVLLRVCKKWRDITLQTPRLWTTINVEIHAGRVLPPLCQINTWLLRSRDAPLYLSINQPMQWGIDESNAARVIELFALHISHWSTVMLALPSASAANALGANSTKTPHQLEALTLTCIQYTYLPSELQTFKQNLSTSMRAPRLRSLNFDGPFGLTGIDGIQWDCLTELMLTSVESSHATLCLLHKCPMLHRCHLSTQPLLHLPQPAVHLLSDVDVPDMVTVPNLFELKLSIEGDIRTVISHLCLPSLQDLSLEESLSLDRAILPPSGILPFLDRSRCSLNKLKLHIPLDCAETLQILSHPSLETLTSLVMRGSDGPEWPLPHPILSEQVLDALTISNEGHCILPNIESFSFDKCINTQVGSSIRQMVLSRWNSYSPLRRFIWDDVMSVEEMGSDDRALLCQAEKEGLKIYIATWQTWTIGSFNIVGDDY